MLVILFFFFKQKTAYEMRISDWSSDVCSSDLQEAGVIGDQRHQQGADEAAADRAEPADDDDDEDQHVDLHAHVGGQRLAVEGPEHAAEHRQRRAGDEDADEQPADAVAERSEEHTSELQSLMRI